MFHVAAETSLFQCCGRWIVIFNFYMRACFTFLGKKDCGGGGRDTGSMLPILQPCFMTLIQFVLHTEFSNFLITNIIEYDLLRLLFFWYHTCRPHSFKSLPIQKNSFWKDRFSYRHESLIRYSVNIPQAMPKLNFLNKRIFFLRNTQSFSLGNLSY